MRRPSAAWLAAALFLTGATSLIFEVIWTRFLSLSLGATPVATSVVVGAFMGGMAAGSWITGGKLRTADPVRTFAWTQAWIGIYALISPALIVLAAVEPLPRGLMLAAVALLPATVAMGASLPCLVRALDGDVAPLATTVGRLYAVATAGAVIGPLVAVYLLFPSLGLHGSLLATAVVNLSVAGWALAVGGGRAQRTSIIQCAWGPTPTRFTRFARRPLALPRPAQLRFSELVGPHPHSLALLGRLVARAAGARGAGVPSLCTPSPVTRTPGRMLMVAVAVSGAMALIAELAWSRTLAMVYGSTVHGLALMLSTYLFGIAAGSGVAAAGLRRWRGDAGMRAIGWLLVASSGAVFASLFAGRRLPLVFLDLVGAGLEGPLGLVAAELVISSLLMLPATMCLGAMLPAAVAAAATGPQPGTRTSVVSSLYAANLTGAAAGTALASLALTAGVGFDAVLRLSVLAALAVAMAIVAREPRLRLGTMAVAALTGVVVLTVDSSGGRLGQSLGVYSAAPSDRPYDAAGMEHVVSAHRLLYYRDGLTATVAVHQVDRYRQLKINGRTDASNDAGDIETQTLVAHLPIFAARAPQRVAVIGWGSGMTAAAALSHPVTSVDAFEIEPAVVEASAYFDELTGGPLDDDRLHVTLGDARRLLRVHDEPYDVIISQPSGPWVTSPANFFTLEFFELAASRLAPDGVMGQRVHLYGLSDASVRSLVATFREVFPHTLIFTDRDLILLGGRKPIRYSLAAMAERFRNPDVAGSLARTFVTYPADLLVKLRLDEEGVAQLAAGAPVNTDDNMRLELAAPRSLYVDDVEATERALWRHPASPLAVMTGYQSEAGALMELAASSFTAGRDDDALAYCEQALARESSFAGLKLLGQIEQRRGRLDRARMAWESALATGGDQAGRRFVHALLDSL